MKTMYKNIENFNLEKEDKEELKNFINSSLYDLVECRFLDENVLRVDVKLKDSSSNKEDTSKQLLYIRKAIDFIVKIMDIAFKSREDIRKDIVQHLAKNYNKYIDLQPFKQLNTMTESPNPHEATPTAKEETTPVVNETTGGDKETPTTEETKEEEKETPATEEMPEEDRTSEQPSEM